MKVEKLSLAVAMFAGTLIAADNTTFSGTLSVTTSWQHRKTVGASTIMERIPTILEWIVTDGTNENQMSAFVSQTVTAIAGATNHVNLAAAINAFGDSVNFKRIAFIGLQTSASNSANVVMGGATADAFDAWNGGATHTIKVAPGGLALFVAPNNTNGYTVGTSTNLWIINSATNASATYYLYLGGTE